MSVKFIIHIPQSKNRNPLVASCTGKSQIMRDKRLRRAKDARNHWKNEEY